MMPDIIVVLVGGIGLIAFLAWFFFGSKEGRGMHSGVQENTMRSDAADASALERCDLTIRGMHCASCVGRVEQALKRVPGVQDATVNLLVERGAVEFDARQARPEDLIAAVETAGYDAAVVQLDDLGQAPQHDAAHSADNPSEIRELRRRFLISLSLTIPVLVMGMGPHIGLIPMHLTMQPWWNWMQLALTTPVLFWAGIGFFVGAWTALKQRASDMNTLIAMGTFA